MANQAYINEGGINGTGEGLVNPNSKEFLVLQQKIQDAAAKRDPIARIEDQLLGIRFRMESYFRDPEPGKLIPAGQFLQECIQALNINRKELAAYIRYEESNLSALCHGRRKISPELAIKFSRIFQIPAALWLGIQNKAEIFELNSRERQTFSDLDLRDLLNRSA